VIFISEALANWQVERLESLIYHARSRAKADKLKSSSLVSEHLNLADEHLDDAISAMKYRRFDQASYACQSGFVQLGLAELLLRYGKQLDAGMRKAMLLAGQKEHAPEEEELSSYLASLLAQMKVAIEYSNCQVSERARNVLDHAMDYYNDALSAIKSSNPGKAKNCAQAGLLKMLLASELISAENQMALPGWRGLTNPMLVSQLRRATQLVSELAETRQRLHKKEKYAPETLSKEEADKNLLLRKHWEKAFNDFTLAVHSLATGSTAHAQALVKGALREMEVVREIIGIEDPDAIQEELEAEPVGRLPVTDALNSLAEIKNMIAETHLQRKEYVFSCLDKVERTYREAIKSYEKGRFEKAERSVVESLQELDLARQQIHFRKQKFTGIHSTG
jgi:hypothetical protein